jgi:hypothetical protein
MLGTIAQPFAKYNTFPEKDWMLIPRKERVGACRWRDVQLFNGTHPSQWWIIFGFRTHRPHPTRLMFFMRTGYETHNTKTRTA